MLFVFQPEDLFVQTMDQTDLSCPHPEKKLKKSQCTPLFMNAYTLRSESMGCFGQYILGGVEKS